MAKEQAHSSTVSPKHGRPRRESGAIFITLMSATNTVWPSHTSLCRDYCVGGNLDHILAIGEEVVFWSKCMALFIHDCKKQNTEGYRNDIIFHNHREGLGVGGS